MSEQSAVDQEHLAMLKEIMDDEFLVLLDTYLTDSDMRLEVLHDTLRSDDTDAFFKAAHSFKGSSGNIGAMKLSELCKHAEKKGREGDLSGMQDHLTDIEAEFERVKQVIASFM